MHTTHIHSIQSKPVLHNMVIKMALILNIFYVSYGLTLFLNPQILETPFTKSFQQRKWGYVWNIIWELWGDRQTNRYIQTDPFCKVPDKTVKCSSMVNYISQFGIQGKLFNIAMNECTVYSMTFSSLNYIATILTLQ